MSARRKIATVIAGATVALGAAATVALVHPIQVPHISFGAEQPAPAPEAGGAAEAPEAPEAPGVADVPEPGDTPDAGD